MHDTIKMRGEYAIEARDNEGGLLWRRCVKNLLTGINRTVRSQMLLGAFTGGLDAMQIKYIAFGTGTTAPNADDTQLETEVFRKQITQITNPSAGVVRSVVSLGALECNTTIREIGVFCGASATSTANSGTMISRVAVNIAKNSNIVLNIVRTDTCEL